MTWNLRSGETFLPHVSVAELKRLAAQEKNAKSRMRFLIAMHRKHGKSIDAIAAACAVPRRTVHGTLLRFQERGIVAAHAIKQSGRPRQLTNAQLRDLRTRVLRSPRLQGFNNFFWTTRLVLALVQREYGVVYDASHMRRLLYELGFSCKKPRPTHYKSSPQAQETFKKKHVAKSNEHNASGAPSFAWTSHHLSSHRI